MENRVMIVMGPGVSCLGDKCTPAYHSWAAKEVGQANKHRKIILVYVACKKAALGPFCTLFWVA